MKKASLIIACLSMASLSAWNDWHPQHIPSEYEQQSLNNQREALHNQRESIKNQERQLSQNNSPFPGSRPPMHGSTTIGR